MRNQRPGGCQLLALKNRIREEGDASEKLRLRQREVKMMLELGQIPQAILAARELPPDGTGLSILGDALCKGSRWKDAEAVFEAARKARLDEGCEARALALARGPLFHLAEARRDFCRCSMLADLPVLVSRVSRLTGRAAVPPDTEGFPWETLALLERCHAGGDPGELVSAVAAWGRSEREWKWRAVYEGMSLSHASGASVHQWRRVFRSMPGTVLDPRWPAERRTAKAILGTRSAR